MSGDELFSNLPIQKDMRVADPGEPRMREPVRGQIELRAVDLEALVAAEHPVRVIWAYVEQLDLRQLEEAIRARTHTAGQAPASPRLLLALWLYATSEGVGSARALARLCESHDVYRWLCGGVSVNYHGLADFRTAHPELLDRLLRENVASLSVAEVIDLDEVAQDGVRVRAAAGTGSFRRRKKLHKELRKAQRLIRQLKEETTDDPQASSRRIVAARERAAREREARVAAALKKLAEIEAERERRSKTNKKQVEKQKEPRTSTTDPDARIMKMADGGFRPAYNCQISTVAGGQIVVLTDGKTIGSDRGLARPMLDDGPGHRRRLLINWTRLGPRRASARPAAPVAGRRQRTEIRSGCRTRPASPSDCLVAHYRRTSSVRSCDRRRRDPGGRTHDSGRRRCPRRWRTRRVGRRVGFPRPG